MVVATVDVPQFVSAVQGHERPPLELPFAAEVTKPCAFTVIFAFV